MNSKFLSFIKEVLPPFILKFLVNLKKKINKAKFLSSPKNQELDLYYDPKMAEILDMWGERNAWIEIQHILHNKKDNKILDIACGTGKVIDILQKNLNLSQIYGCDISDFLIGKARDRGIDKDKLKICDATNLPYKKNEFDYNYSIGSLEHFTREGILKFLSSSMEVTRLTGYHMIPVSRNQKDNGWIVNHQSYFNNSLEWWLSLCSQVSSDFYFLDSSWEDEISVGKWIIINKNNDD
jgi:ubiquinone/menaquinone biosynthesis C-methylase UbiE